MIKIKDGQSAVIADCPADPIAICVRFVDEVNPANIQVAQIKDGCAAHVAIEQMAFEACTDEITYGVKLYPFDGADTVVVVEPIVVTVGDGNTSKLVFDSRMSDTAEIAANGLPLTSRYCSREDAHHRIQWIVEDGCSNQTVCEYIFRLKDCKAPSLICVGLHTALMPSSNEVTIWAADFDARSFDHCTPAEDLIYGFSEHSYLPSMTFNGDSVRTNDDNMCEVKVWVADHGYDANCDEEIDWHGRNQDFCTTFLMIQTKDNACSDAMIAGGTVRSEDTLRLEEVTVKLMWESGEVMPSMQTKENGDYVFENALQSYSIEPRKDGDYRCGVSTLDLVRIQKPLLGISPIESPYQLIAADANNSESVSAVDLIEIRKLILGISTEFPSNTSWRFVGAAFEFDDPLRPWPFAETIALSGGFGMDEDFIGVNVGEVNGSVTSLTDDISRDGQALVLQVTDRAVQTGERVLVDLMASDFSDVVGMQGTFACPNLCLMGVLPGALDLTSEQVAEHRHILAFSWYHATDITVPDDEILLTLEFEVQSAGSLGAMLMMTSRATNAEAYKMKSNGGYHIQPIEIQLEEMEVGHAVDFALFQNEPHPFTEETVINFTLLASLHVRLIFFDAAGRLVLEFNGEYRAGSNTITVSREALPAGGVHYYCLDVVTSGVRPTSPQLRKYSRPSRFFEDTSDENGLVQKGTNLLLEFFISRFECIVDAPAKKPSGAAVLAQSATNLQVFLDGQDR